MARSSLGQPQNPLTTKHRENTYLQTPLRYFWLRARPPCHASTNCLITEEDTASALQFMLADMTSLFGFGQKHHQLAQSDCIAQPITTPSSIHGTQAPISVPFDTFACHELAFNATP